MCKSTDSSSVDLLLLLHLKGVEKPFKKGCQEKSRRRHLEGILSDKSSTDSGDRMYALPVPHVTGQNVRFIEADLCW